MRVSQKTLDHDNFPPSNLHRYPEVMQNLGSLRFKDASKMGSFDVKDCNKGYGLLTARNREFFSSVQLMTQLWHRLCGKVVQWQYIKHELFSSEYKVNTLEYMHHKLIF